MEIDKESRMLNAKSHTAGHLIQCVVEEIDSGLQAVKGFHFPVGSYVEFCGESIIDSQECIHRANIKIKEMIENDVETNAIMMSKEEIMNVCPNLPYNLPEGKPLRVMQIGDNAPVPCGGTHLRSLGELGRVELKKMKRKKGNIKASYSVE